MKCEWFTVSLLTHYFLAGMVGYLLPLIRNEQALRHSISFPNRNEAIQGNVFSLSKNTVRAPWSSYRPPNNICSPAAPLGKVWFKAQTFLGPL